jgi:uncharacterized DUF497 family protein
MELAVLKGVVGFEWDEGNVRHIARHHVLPDEAEEVFFDIENVVDEDLEHSAREQRFLIIGKTEQGRLLYQIFTRRGDKIRVVSSRDINRREVELYEKKAGRTKVSK